MAEPAKPLLPADVEAALARGDFIGAIKLLRGATGVGLQDARAAIDRFRRRGPAAAAAPGMQQGLQHGAQGSKASASFANGALPPQVVEAVDAGRTIEAIRLLREHSGIGLKDAKDAVDRYADQRRAAFGPLSPGEVPRAGTRVWAVVIVVALVWLAWRLLRSAG